MENQKLPVDVLVEIAMNTKDLISVMDQCKTNKAIARRCNNRFWKTWVRKHNPEFYIVMNTIIDTVYDQLFFTAEDLYDKLNDVLLISVKNEIDELLEGDNLIPTFKNVTTGQIYDKLKKLERELPTIEDILENMYIIKFRSIPESSFFILIMETDTRPSRRPGRTAKSKYSRDRASVVGVYKQSEVEEKDIEYRHKLQLGTMWWVKIDMNKFKIGELTKGLPNEITMLFHKYKV